MSKQLSQWSQNALRFIWVVLGCFVFVGCFWSDAANEKSVVELFVAPQGNDEAAGTVDAPLATLERAGARICELRDCNSVIITLRGGVYPRDASFDIKGGLDVPLLIRSFPGETAVLVGGMTVPLNKFTPVQDETVLQRIPADARSRIVQLDLNNFSTKGLARMPLSGHSMQFLAKATRYKTGPQGTELFFNGQRQTLARWPNEGYAETGKVIEKGDIIRGWMGDAKDGKALDAVYVPQEERPDPPAGFCFQFDNPRLARWKTAGRFMMFGFWYYDWSDQTVQVQSIDLENKTIRSVQPGAYGVKSGQRFYVYDLLEELDVPGEWYIDHEQKILYIYPPTADPDAVVELSMLEDPIIRIRNGSFVTLRDLSIRSTRGCGILVEGGQSVTIDRCTVSNTGGNGINVRGGRGHRIVNCEISNVGAGGIEISGGNRDTLESSGHVVSNNWIHNFSVIRRTYTPGIAVNGVGIHVAHNEISHAPHFGIRFSGNNHLIEYNYLHDLLWESNDAGAIYSGRSWMSDGTVIRYNLLRDITGFAGDPHLKAKGIYLDDGISGITVHGNIFENVAEGFFINGGRANTVTGNLFINCGHMARATDLSEAYKGWAKMSWRTLNQEMEREKARWSSEPWQSRFSRLSTLLQDEPQFPKNNRIYSNVCYRTEILFGKDGIQEPVVRYGRVEANSAIEDSPGHFDEARQRYIIEDPAVKDIPFLEIGRDSSQCPKN